MTEKRFKLLYSKLDNGMFVDREKHFEDVIVDKEFQKVGLTKLVDLLNKLADENEQLKHRIEGLKRELNNCEEDYILEEYL